MRLQVDYAGSNIHEIHDRSYDIIVVTSESLRGAREETIIVSGTGRWRIDKGSSFPCDCDVE